MGPFARRIGPPRQLVRDIVPQMVAVQVHSQGARNARPQAARKSRATSRAESSANWSSRYKSFFGIVQLGVSLVPGFDHIQRDWSVVDVEEGGCGFSVARAGQLWQNGLKLMAKKFHGRLVRLSPVPGAITRDEYPWKNTAQLLELLIESVSKGGNLLLNVGPTARGVSIKKSPGEAKINRRMDEV